MRLLTVTVALTSLYAATADGGTPLSLQPCTSETGMLWHTNPSLNQILVGDACLDVDNYGTTPGSTVWAYSPCHPEDKNPAHQNEAWTIGSDGTIKEISTGLCLDAPTGIAGSAIVINKCSGAATQKWTMSADGHITNGADSKQCLYSGTVPWESPCDQAPGNSMPFCDYSQSFKDRVTSLVGNLTTDEKMGLFANGAKAVPRLNIPAYQWWSEALHGVAGSPGVHFGGNLPNATSFPQVITTAASFNTTLFHSIASVISTEGRAFNNEARAGLTFWTPNINIIRDPRWGRGQETPGEDPYLTSEYAANFVTGFQFGSDATYLKASSCCKHYADYDLENWHGVDRHHFNAIVTEQDQQDTYLPAFESCVTRGHGSSLMCSYNAINGVPSCANKGILNDLARGKWGFEGYITSDCGAVSNVIATHHYTNTSDATCYDVLDAGMDIDCGGYLDSNLPAAVADGSVPIALVDTALTNLFMVQFRLGLFDPASKQPYRSITAASVDTKEHQDLALAAAHQGMVLLKNTNKALPWKAPSLSSVAIVGPNGDATHTMQGNYNGVAPYLISPVDGVKAFVPSTTFNSGCDNVACAKTDGFAAAVAAAKTADATVVIVGLDQTQESEGHDRDDIGLPGQQAALISAITAAAKGPVVAVVMAGGPVDITPLKTNDKIQAIVWCGYPGQSGGQAIADVLFGAVNPGGRLPYTMYPSAFTALTMFDMNMRPNKTAGNPGHTYRFYTGEPVYEFGTGLSYTTFSYSNNVEYPTLSSAAVESQLRTTAKQVDAEPMTSVSITVKNTGDVAGDDVVLAFVKPPQPGVDGAPLKSLRGFARVFLQPGQSTTVTFPMSAFDFTFADTAGEFHAIPGDWSIVVGDQTSTVTIA